MVTMLRIGDRRHWNGEQPGEEDRHAQVSIIFNLPRKGFKRLVIMNLSALLIMEMAISERVVTSQGQKC